jgi:hypothetical protein
VVATGQPTGAPAAPAYGSAQFAADTKALRKLNIFAIILLVGSAVGIITTVVSFTFGLYSSFRIAPTGSTPTSVSAFLVVYGAITAVGATVSIVALLELRSALKSLAGIDKAHFELPAKLTLLLILTEPVLLLGVFGFLYAIVALSGTGSFPTSAIVYLLVGLLLEGVGGIAAIAGTIGGAILGMWRMGERYGESPMQVSAILYIIPFLQIVGAILLLIGVNSARGKVAGAAPVQTAS